MQYMKSDWQQKLTRLSWRKLTKQDLESLLPANPFTDSIFELDPAADDYLKVSFYVDFDHNFFAVFTLLQEGDHSFTLNQKISLDDPLKAENLILKQLLIKQFFKMLKLEHDIVLPQIRLYRANLLSEIFTFIYQIIPLLLPMGQVYFSPDAAEVMFSDHLPVKFVPHYDAVHQSLQIKLLPQAGFTSKDLESAYQRYLDDLAPEQYQDSNGELYYLASPDVQLLMDYLYHMDWTEIDLLRGQKNHSLFEIPNALHSLTHLLPPVYHAFTAEDLAKIQAGLAQIRPLGLSLPRQELDQLSPAQLALLEDLSQLYSTGFGGAVIFKKREWQQLALYLAYLVQNQYKDNQALYLGSSAELNYLAELTQDLLPDLTIRLIQGPVAARQQLLREKPATACLYLTTYTLYMNDLAFYENMQLDLLLLAASPRLASDHATAQALKAQKAATVYVFGDQGLADAEALWSLVSLVLAEHFPDKEQFLAKLDDESSRLRFQLEHLLLEAIFY